MTIPTSKNKLKIGQKVRPTAELIAWELEHWTEMRRIGSASKTVGRSVMLVSDALEYVFWITAAKGVFTRGKVTGYASVDPETGEANVRVTFRNKFAKASGIFAERDLMRIYA